MNLEELFLKLQNKIKDSNNILITLSSPDGDSIGSSLALNRILKSLNKSITVQSSFDIPEYLKFVPDITEIKISDIGKTEFKNFDFIILVDSANAFRAVSFDIYGNTWDFPTETFVVSFDHHGTHDYQFADIDIFDKDSSSTCELVYRFSKYLNINIDSITSTLLFLGLYTDTGGFYHDNTKPITLKCAGELLEIGADKHGILSGLNTQYEINSLKLLSYSLSNIKVIKENNFSYAITVFDKESLKGFTEDDIETSSNILKGNPGFIKNIKETDFGVLVIEYEKEVKISFRETENRFDLSIIAKAMGGGGHSKACAYSSTKDLNTAVTELKEKIRETYSQSM